jgi:hypothetical protein
MKLNLLVAAATAAFAVAGAASAAINVSIWLDQPGAGADATIAQAAGLGAPDATTTVSAINFDSRVTGYTVGQFLNGAVLPAGVATHDLNNTYMLFTGSTFLHAGINSFVVPHDDGLQLNIDGIGLVVDQPGPTAPEDTPFDVNAPADGVYTFQLSYGEVFGPPAVLGFAVNDRTVTGGVPEPGAWALMLMGFAGMGAALRRNRRAAAAA